MDEDDDAPEAGGDDWDVAATKALAELVKAANTNPHNALQAATLKAANAMAQAIEDYHKPEQAAPGVTH